MINQLKNIIQELHANTPDYVHTVSYGYKMKNGSYTDELCIVFEVLEKKPISEIPPSEILPSSINVDNQQVKTDVIACPMPELISNCFARADSSSSAHRIKQRPLIGGISIPFINNENYIGTLGGFFRDKDDNSIVALTNAHVALNDMRRSIINSQKLSTTPVWNTQGRFVLQTTENPRPINYLQDDIGYVKRYYPLNRTGYNDIDAAVVGIDTAALLSSSISTRLLGLNNLSPLPIATPQEIDDLLVGPKTIIKSGRTTGFTGDPSLCPIIPHNILGATSINLGGGLTVAFSDLIYISYQATTTSIYNATPYTVPRENVVVPGDSGSLACALINGQYKIIGLIFAAGPLLPPSSVPYVEWNRGIMCKIHNVLSKLNLEAWDGTNLSVNPETNWTYLNKPGMLSNVTIVENGHKYWQIGTNGSLPNPTSTYVSYTVNTGPQPTLPTEATTETEPPEPPQCCFSDPLQRDRSCCPCDGENYFPPEIQWTINSNNIKLITADDLHIRFDFYDSANCSSGLYTRSGIQIADVDGTFTIPQPMWLSLKISGRVEGQNYNYDKLSIKIDGVPITLASSDGVGNGCNMTQNIIMDIEDPIIRLTAGTHTISLCVNTIDGLFHLNAYYKVELTFLDLIDDNCLCCSDLQLTDLVCDPPNQCEVYVTGCSIDFFEYACRCDNVAVRARCVDQCFRQHIAYIGTLGDLPCLPNIDWKPVAPNVDPIVPGTYSFNPYPCSCTDPPPPTRPPEPTFPPDFPTPPPPPPPRLACDYQEYIGPPVDVNNVGPELRGRDPANLMDSTQVISKYGEVFDIYIYYRDNAGEVWVPGIGAVQIGCYGGHRCTSTKFYPTLKVSGTGLSFTLQCFYGPRACHNGVTFAVIVKDGQLVFKGCVFPDQKVNVDGFICETPPTPETTTTTTPTTPTPAPCAVHFSGGILGGSSESWGGIVIGQPSPRDKVQVNACDIVYPGQYPSTAAAIPNSIYRSWDGFAIPIGLRLTVYSQPNYTGDVVFSGIGPMVIGNLSRKDSYSSYLYANYPDQQLQLKYPQSVRFWSPSSMFEAKWTSGSFIIDGECGTWPTFSVPTETTTTPTIETTTTVTTETTTTTTETTTTTITTETPTVETPTTPTTPTTETTPTVPPSTAVTFEVLRCSDSSLWSLTVPDPGLSNIVVFNTYYIITETVSDCYSVIGINNTNPSIGTLVANFSYADCTECLLTYFS